MASATTMSAFDKALKQYYIREQIENLTYPNHPFLALLPKDEKFRGKNMPQPVIYGSPQGRSASFSNAQSNASASKIVEFLLTRKKNYGVVTIDGETLEASQGNEYAFLSATTTEINGILRSIADDLSRDLFRSGTGVIGSTTTTTGTTIDLVTDNDALNFEVGMEISFFDAATGGTQFGGAGASRTVTAVDRTATSNQITVGTSLNALSLSGTSYIAVEGDYDSKITGLAGWIPSSSPSATAFFGLDRTVDPTRLAGIRYTGTSQPIDEALIDASVLVAREGGKPDHVFLSFTDFGKLIKILGAQVQRDVASTGKWSFSGLEMYAPHGVMKIVPDKDCPVSTAYMLQLDTWKLRSIGKVPRILNQDGMEMLRQSADDGVEVRAGYYAQLGCNAPGWNATISLAS